MQVRSKAVHHRPVSACLDTGRTLQPRNNCMEVELGGEAEQQLGNTSVQQQEGEKENFLLQSDLLTKRRGSAPSNLILGPGGGAGAGVGGGPHQARLQDSSSRRGSLPSDLLHDSLASLPGKPGPAVYKGSQHHHLHKPGKRAGLLRRRSLGPELLQLQTVQHCSPAHNIKERQLVQKYLSRPF